MLGPEKGQSLSLEATSIEELHAAQKVAAYAKLMVIGDFKPVCGLYMPNAELHKELHKYNELVFWGTYYGHFDMSWPLQHSFC